MDGFPLDAAQKILGSGWDGDVVILGQGLHHAWRHQSEGWGSVRLDWQYSPTSNSAGGAFGKPDHCQGYLSRGERACVKRRFWRRLPALSGTNGDLEPSRTALSIRSCCGTTGSGAFDSAGSQSIGIHSKRIDTNPMEYIRNGTDWIGMQWIAMLSIPMDGIDHAARRRSGINDGGPAAFHQMPPMW